MKTFHKVILTTLLIQYSSLAFSQSVINNPKVDFIKMQCAYINKYLNSYKKIEKTDTSETTQGNQILLYFSNNEIKEIAATYYGETGKALQEYYFFNKKLIFCYSAEYKYEIPINADNSNAKIKSIKEKRYYFDNGNLFLARLNPVAVTTKPAMKELSININKEVQRLMKLK